MKPISDQTAGDVMHKPLVTMRPSQSLAEVERILVEHHISGVPVVENDRLVGVITRSDIARLPVLSEMLDSQVSDELQWTEQADGFKHSHHGDSEVFRNRVAKLTVGDVMRHQVVTCRHDTPLVEVAVAMIKNHIHRLIVTEGDRPIGIVSSLDIVALVASDLKSGQ